MRRNHSNNVNEKDEKSRPEDEAILILIILLLLLFERKVQSILFQKTELQIRRGTEDNSEIIFLGEMVLMRFTTYVL